MPSCQEWITGDNNNPYSGDSIFDARFPSLLGTTAVERFIIASYRASKREENGSRGIVSDFVLR